MSTRAFIEEYLVSRPKGPGVHLFYGTESEIRAAREAIASHIPTKLPSGIRLGTITTVVAGVGLAAGALYAFAKKRKEPPVGQWTSRIAAEGAPQQIIDR